MKHGCRRHIDTSHFYLHMVVLVLESGFFEARIYLLWFVELIQVSVNDLQYDLNNCDIIREVSDLVNVDIHTIFIFFLPEGLGRVLLHHVGYELS